MATFTHAHGLFWPTSLGRILIYGSVGGLPLVDNSFLTEEDKTILLPTAPLGFLFVVIGSISLPFVRLIKSAICRQRVVSRKSCLFPAAVGR